jgi:S1-C subfamily serine protease
MELSTFSDQLASVAAHASQAIVAVHARRGFNSSGVHWSPGVVVTADHAVRRDDGIRITTPAGALIGAELAGRDPGTDLAVLRVPGLEIPVATRAEQAAFLPGSLILALGRFKDSPSAALGVIGSVSGPSQTWRGGKLDQVVRLNLSADPGASGGAVVNADGKLIGIATAALSRVSTFAIPVLTVARVAEKLLAHGRIPRGYLGIGLQPIAIPEHLKSKLNLPAAVGLIAVSVDREGAAGTGGIVIGDILLELGGRVLQRLEDLQAALDAESIGRKLKVRLLRGGEPQELEVTVGERPHQG